jgi:hypothetical protein
MIASRPQWLRRPSRRCPRRFVRVADAGVSARSSPVARLFRSPRWTVLLSADVSLPSTSSCVQPLPCVPLRRSTSDHVSRVRALRCFFPVGTAPGRNRLPDSVTLRVELLDDSGQIHYRWVPNERVPFASCRLQSTQGNGGGLVSLQVSEVNPDRETPS